MLNKYVKVIWRDIMGITSGDNACAWMNRAQIAEEGQKCYDHEHTSVGEIVVANDDFIILVATSDNDIKETLYSDASMIMKSVIIRIEELVDYQDDKPKELDKKELEEVASDPKELTENGYVKFKGNYIKVYRNTSLYKDEDVEAAKYELVKNII